MAESTASQQCLGHNVMMMSNPPVSFDETRKSLRTPGGLAAWRSHLGAQEHRSDLEPPPASHLLRFRFPGSAAIRCHGSCQVPGRSSETRPCLQPPAARRIQVRAINLLPEPASRAASGLLLQHGPCPSYLAFCRPACFLHTWTLR